MPVPEGSPNQNDMVDVVIQSSTKTELVEQKDGSFVKQQLLDPEILWWKSGDIGSINFGRFAFELKEFERQAIEAINHMMPERARQFAKTIISIGESYRRSVDAKSSESMRDRDNSKSTLLDKVGKNKIEKVYTQKGEVKKSLLDSFTGAKQKQDMEND